MNIDVIELTKELVAIESETQHTNAPVSDAIADVMKQIGFDVERLSYDDGGVEKVNLVGKLSGASGNGASGNAASGKGGGLGLFGHSDTVPGGEGWDAWDPMVADGKLYGRGSCDMKGPIAAMLAAAAQADVASMQNPLFIVVTSDEEMGHVGARYVVEHSELLAAGWPACSVVGEPTELAPVYAHKGGYRVVVTARGVAAHTSTDRGVSANLLIAPFMNDMVEIAALFKSDERFMNHEFDPPTNGFNMVIDDGGCKPNVTAAKTVCTVAMRAMPDAHIEEAAQMIIDRAKAHDLEVESRGFNPFYVDPASEAVQAACRATGHEKALAVPYGTEAIWYQAHSQTVVLGPGNIAQAHTKGEWVEVEQLHGAVDVYGRMIADLCL